MMTTLPERTPTMEAVSIPKKKEAGDDLSEKTTGSKARGTLIVMPHRYCWGEVK